MKHMVNVATLKSSATRRIERIVTGPIASRVTLDPLLDWGWKRYQADGETPALAYRAMRASFVHPASASFTRLEQRASAEQPVLDLPAPAPGLIVDSHADVLDGLRRDGFVVLPTLLPDAVCDEIETRARSAECTLVGAGEGSPAKARFDADRPLARRYDIPEEELLACEAVQNLLADVSLLRLAQEYLGASPVQDIVAGWWSAPGPAEATAAASKAAQLFHFDLDRPRFVKIFVYLTDVGPDTGPHAYVKGTHRALPADFRSVRRFSDAEVERSFADQISRIPGPRGTIFVADTRGIHKGEPVVRGHRLVVQLELSVSLFGQRYSRPVLRPKVPALDDAIRRYPSVYRRFSIAPNQTGT